MVYMDYNATAPVDPEVLEAFLPFYRDVFGNPSSVHQAGRRVKRAIEESRERVAAFLSCRPVEVVFTSSGTEADNMALKGSASALRHIGNHIVTTAVEHPAILNPCLHLEQQGVEVTRLGVERDGTLDAERLEKSITDRTILISVMHANNETGVMFPVEKIGEMAASRRIQFHCDAVQSAGKVPVDCATMKAGLLSISGHKLGAPQGVGALVVRTGAKLRPLIQGGSQERNRRAGTENVAGIVALGKACELAQSRMGEDSRNLASLRDRLEGEIVAAIPGVHVNGGGAERLPNTSNLSFAACRADSLLAALDLEGIAASSGSACSSGTLRLSHVLAAMGCEPELAAGSLRFSLGRASGAADVERLLRVLPAMVERVRRGGAPGSGSASG